jgi:hypothetical protein
VCPTGIESRTACDGRKSRCIGRQVIANGPLYFSLTDRKKSARSHRGMVEIALMMRARLQAVRK